MRKSWRKSIDWFWDIVGGVNIRTKIMGIVLGGTILLSLGLTVQVHHALRQIMEQELLARGISIGRDLAARSTDLILVNDLYGLNQLLAETQENNADIRYAFVLDPNRAVLAHTFGEGFPTELVDLNPVEPDSYQSNVSVQTPDGLVVDIAVPVFGGQAGVARVGLSTQSVLRALGDLTSGVLMTTALVLGLSLTAAAFLTFILTRPILEVVEAARTLGRGDFSPRVRRWANDEIGDLAEAFNQMAVELGRADGDRRERELLRRQLLDRVISAQEEERRHIARELHDSTSQSLTSLMVGLQTLESICDDSRLHAYSRELRNVASEILDDVHRLAVQLRPAVLDDLGLPAALERLAKEWQQRHAIPLDVIVHLGPERLPESIETTLYRSIQEALTNVARHARAGSVSVLVERRPHDVVAVVEDDGQGFNIDRAFGLGHLGLLGIRERAESLKGSLTIESSSKGGTSLFIRLPLAHSDLLELREDVAR